MNYSESAKIKADDIYELIAMGSLYVDLRAALFCNPDQVRVFPNAEIAEAFSNLKPSTRPVLKVNTIKLDAGSKIILYENVWTVLSKTAEGLVLHSDKAQEQIKLTFTKIDELLEAGFIKSFEKGPPTDLELQASKIIRSASEKKALEKANEIYKKILPFINGDTENISEMSERTVRNYIKKYKEAEELYGFGFLGLLPKTRPGNQKRKIPEEAVFLMLEIIKTNYETLKNKTKKNVYGELILSCKEKGLHPPSYKTFLTEIKNRHNHDQVEKMGGKRMAYKFKEHYRGEETWARHGDYPFHVGHIDHTKLDIELVCPETGQNLGRPWLTILMDAYSRKVICHVLSFDPPSYRSCLLIIRRCVQLYNRFFSILVTDNGKEFESIYFEKLLSYMEVVLKKRPPSEARYGSICERIIRTANTQLVYALSGNTQLSKNPRQLSGKANPKKQATWTLKGADENIFEYFYEVYNKQVHSTIKQSPDDKFTNGLERFGERVCRRIEYNEDFLILTMPTNNKGTAKVNYTRGIKIRGVYYWNDVFRNPKIAGQKVEIKYDPFDIGTAYAYVKGQWEKCLSEFYKKLQGYNEQEIRFFTESLRQKDRLLGNSTSISAIKLAEMIRRLEQKENMQKKELEDLRQKENKRAFKSTDKSPANNEQAPKSENDLKSNSGPESDDDDGTFEVK